MNRRSFLSAMPAVALAVSPAGAMQPMLSPRERLKNALDDIENIFNELYPDLKVKRHLSEIREIDQYDPSHVMLSIIAA